MYVLLGVILLVLTALTANYSVRSTVTWFLASDRIKLMTLLSQPAGGELSHYEWDGRWGNPVYVVFDPNNSLSTAAASHKSGKFSGIPCEVYRVRRLESRWYTVQFYPKQKWEHCANELP